MSALLGGRIAVVTGGASGIGKAISQTLAKHGARVVVADLDSGNAAATAKALPASQSHSSFACDVSNADSVKGLSEHVKSLGTPSILVNCAGITKDSTLLKMKQEQWDSVIKVNLTGVFHVSQAFVKASVDNNNHPLSIINVSSIVGKMGNFGQTNYAATKAGVIGFTKSAAKELAKKNVRVNAVLPGFIKTPMTEAMPPTVLAEICKGIPMGRMGEAEEIANSVLYLASDLSSYVTGATLEVTGGFSM
ncbi:(3R)-3-hydroxyacyl-CoA dehydrogenase [Caenorhabditis elegans]|uniref:(3R)-3-hydroxyacyl-CoA dehydrogenase n=1 Tax=Caenorhabditis elegans TaxID=6239 RepID=Q19246_CAEEL|nr:Estradiol 17-beta-dehydrogenase 8 [Caenorhabditis elegans]CCD68284.1 Estradiol 17-beta-dehydrogenase 8 [Caenorhabditis elegans]|eukprot:NP_508282.2 DeHydrogenases, Short chain [Caenorhabditis elegans]